MPFASVFTAFPTLVAVAAVVVAAGVVADVVVVIVVGVVAAVVVVDIVVVIVVVFVVVVVVWPVRNPCYVDLVQVHNTFVLDILVVVSWYKLQRLEDS